MEPFPTPAQVWGEGQTRWHVYVLPREGDEALARLLRCSEQVSVQVAGDALVPTGAFAHATVQQVSLPAAEVPAEQIDALAGELRAALAQMDPFTVTVGNVFGTTGAVLADIDQDLPGEPWHALDQAVREAIRARFGEQALKYESPPPHITVAYCAKETDSGVVASQLRRWVRPSHAPMLVDTVWLLDVHQNVEQRTYTWSWETAVRIPLGRAAVS
jgi:2'-5' RNA ligase